MSEKMYLRHSSELSHYNCMTISHWLMTLLFPPEPEGLYEVLIIGNDELKVNVKLFKALDNYF